MSDGQALSVRRQAQSGALARVPTPAPTKKSAVDATATPSAELSLRESIRLALRDYFQTLDGEPGSNIYQMVLTEVEVPLLEETLAYTGNNKTLASQMLGINRGTLNKKLKQQSLLPKSRN